MIRSYHEQVLEASGLAEKPLLSTNGQTSVEFHLKALQFRYYYLDVLLTVASKDQRSQCIFPARKLLNLLPRLGELIVDTEQPSPGLLWEWLHYPMIAFGTLWGQVLSKGMANAEQNEKILEHVPRFMEKLESLNPMAGKLKSITQKIIQHVSDVYYSSPSQESNTHQDPVENNVQYRTQSEALTDAVVSTQPFDMPTASSDATFDTSLDDLPPLPDDFFLDPTFDWFSWGDQMLS
ncbi:hypothetical protein N0V90_003977 [Kalmusia sp. IMI 367209]|nr:hypothetical protein N0V90_003977 [Kalmusia sp. IMI 367209]